MNLGAFWRILHGVHDLDPTAKFALSVMAAYAEGKQDNTAHLTLSQLQTALSLGDDGTLKAVARAVEADWCSVQNSGGKAWLCTLSPRLVPTPVGEPLRLQSENLSDYVRNLADRAISSSFKELRERERGGDAAATPNGAASPVENRSGGHPDACKCGGTGWVETSPGEARRCVGLRVVE